MFRKLKQELFDLKEKVMDKANSKGRQYLTKEDMDDELSKIMDRFDEIMT